MSHNHQLVFVREFLGDHKVYWCRECGLIMEVFGDNFAEMIPEWSRERLLKEDRDKEKFLFVKDKRKQSRRLGKGLKDLTHTAQTSDYLKKFYVENDNP